MRLGERRGKGSGVWSAVAVGLTLLAALGAVSPRQMATGDVRQLDDFVEKNRTLLRCWLQRPPSLIRDQRVEAYRDNLRWAENCRAGFNSDAEKLERPLGVDWDAP